MFSLVVGLRFARRLMSVAMVVFFSRSVIVRKRCGVSSLVDATR